MFIYVVMLGISLRSALGFFTPEPHRGMGSRQESTYSLYSFLGVL